jgi:hypothetical protein
MQVTSSQLVMSSLTIILVVILPQQYTAHMIVLKFGFCEDIAIINCQKHFREEHLFTFTICLVRGWLNNLEIKNGSSRFGKNGWIEWFSS